MTAVCKPIVFVASKPGRLRLGASHRLAAQRALARCRVEVVVTCAVGDLRRGRDALWEAIPKGCAIVNQCFNDFGHSFVAILHMTALDARRARWPAWVRVVREARL